MISVRKLTIIALLFSSSALANDQSTWSKLPVDTFYEFCLSSPLALFRHQLNLCTDEQGNVEHECATKSQERLLTDVPPKPEECAAPRKPLLPVDPNAA